MQDFNSKDSRENGKDIEYIKKSLGYPEEDIKECKLHRMLIKCILTNTFLTGLKITDYPKDIGEVKKDVIFEVLDILEKSGVVKTPTEGWQLETFVDPDIAKIA